MSLPNIPDITPRITLTQNDAVNLLLASIALEELGLAHILHAEGEKIQAAVEQDASVPELLELNQSVHRMLRGTIQNNMLLHFKLQDALDLLDFKKRPSSGHMCNGE